MTFVVFSKDNCTFCEQAKALLNSKGYDWKENKLDVDFSREELIEMFPHARTFPQVSLVGETNQHIGGFEELKAWIAHRDAVQGLEL